MSKNSVSPSRRRWLDKRRKREQAEREALFGTDDRAVVWTSRTDPAPRKHE